MLKTWSEEYNQKTLVQASLKTKYVKHIFTNMIKENNKTIKLRVKNTKKTLLCCL